MFVATWHQSRLGSPDHDAGLEKGRQRSPGQAEPRLDDAAQHFWQSKGLKTDVSDTSVLRPGPTPNLAPPLQLEKPPEAPSPSRNPESADVLARALSPPEAEELTLNADVAMMPTQADEATASDHTKGEEETVMVHFF